MLPNLQITAKRKSGCLPLPESVCRGGGVQSLPGQRCSPFDTGLNHVTCHQLQPLFQVLSKLFFRPVQVPDEGLKGIQFPEQIFRGARSVTGRIKTKNKTRVTCWPWVLNSQHRDNWGLGGLRQTGASTYKTTRVGGGDGAASTGRP